MGEEWGEGYYDTAALEAKSVSSHSEAQGQSQSLRPTYSSKDWGDEYADTAELKRQRDYAKFKRLLRLEAAKREAQDQEGDDKGLSIGRTVYTHIPPLLFVTILGVAVYFLFLSGGKKSSRAEEAAAITGEDLV